MTDEDLIDDWDEADFEIFKQWDEEAKNKRLEELEEYYKNFNKISSLLNYEQDKRIKLENIIKEAREILNQDKASASFNTAERIALEILDKENK